MLSQIRSITCFALAIAIGGLCSQAYAGKVNARLSTQEAYVGAPVILQIEITDAQDYEPPSMPSIDGCDIRSAGAPSQSSQITIINGRRSQKQSVVMQYLITPRKPGSYEIPALTLNVDGRQVSTKPLRFVATKSETGDLMFVEIEGSKDKVFVGEPLELTLKIWIRPFRDREHDITLSEGDMWSTLSDQSSWGSFSDRMKELAENNQRPGGREVLRDDGKGNERSYYQYNITATVYPKRAGKIDADDVQIVVDYPTALGKSRSPFDSFFGDSPLGGDPFANSPLRGMMDDDFFGSRFGGRLAVTATKPIVGEVHVGSTEVVPIPTEGRPADYRGAVGRYRIVTEAKPAAVNAGDPITLNIGIEGTGPMELVQAPPLFELPTLTKDFKVADQSLAGFVKDNTKVFSTTVRPRHEGITQVPAIPFSFFDPDTEKFETVTSDPIAITVNKSESLSLDAIVGSKSDNAADTDKDGNALASIAKPTGPDFANGDSPSILVSQSPATSPRWWWLFVIVPPCVWLATLVVCNIKLLASRMPSFRSARKQCLAALTHADQASVVDALTKYIARRSGKPCSDARTAVGALRLSGMYEEAHEVEAFLERLEQTAFGGLFPASSADYRQTATALVEKIDQAFAAKNRLRVRVPKSNRALTTSKVRKDKALTQRALILLCFGLAASTATNALAGDAPNTIAALGAQTIELDQSQKRSVLQDATASYSAARLATPESAEAKEMFDTAAKKYQLLVDGGIRNSQLYLNLGNAYLQSGEVGRAIVNYERACKLEPTNRQVIANLEFADSLVKRESTATSKGTPISQEMLATRLRTANHFVLSTIGLTPVIWTLTIASLIFWGILIIRATGFRIRWFRLAIVPMLVLIISLSSIVTVLADTDSMGKGVFVVSDVQIRAGDGDQFDAVASIDSADGHRVDILANRGNWKQIRSETGKTGWVHGDAVEPIAL